MIAENCIDHHRRLNIVHRICCCRCPDGHGQVDGLDCRVGAVPGAFGNTYILFRVSGLWFRVLFLGVRFEGFGFRH